MIPENKIEELAKPTIPPTTIDVSELEDEQAAESEAILNDLEGQRVFGREHYEFWLISVIALAWSLFQLYVSSPLVLEFTPWMNSDVVKRVHLIFASFFSLATTEGFL